MQTIASLFTILTAACYGRAIGGCMGKQEKTEYENNFKVLTRWTIIYIMGIILVYKVY